ncbi:unnamed protein product, partial [Vitis vinifera]
MKHLYHKPVNFGWSDAKLQIIIHAKLLIVDLELQTHSQILPHQPPPPPPRPRSPNSPSPPPISSSYYPSAPHMLLALSAGISGPPENAPPISSSPASGANGRKRFRTKFSQGQKKKMFEFAERVGWKMQKRDEELVAEFCNEVGVDKGVLKVWMHNNKNTFGKRDDAFGLFSEMPCRDVVSWNSMLACYAQCGKPNEALALFDQMRAVGVKPTEATVVSLLSACAHLGALDKGLHLHTYINDNRIEVNSIVGTALVDMYAKCGKISLATQVFNAMESKDVLAWNTIIAGMAIHGHVKEAQRLFKEMKEAGVEPNDITFVAMLSACSHAGMVDEGQKLLDCMSSSYGIEPKVEHYGCVIDLLARAGLLEEAMELIGTMPMEPNPCALGALLGGCRIHGNFELGEMVGKRLINLQPCHSGRYILLSNIYAAAKKWDDARKVRNLMKVNGISKVPGVSVIELKGMVHRFVAGDWSHPESNKIYEKLNEIHTRLKSAIGHSADTGDVLLDMEEEDKEHALPVHSEKLAIAYGLLHLDSKEAIRIVKNLRVCRDCHHVTKLISKVYGREIIVRDRNRFHHFEDGECSCLDFW